MAAYAVESGAASSVTDLLNQVAAIPGRRLFNALLAVLQMPNAKLLCSASEWERKWGRTIRPGERPLVLLFPFGPVEFVFDVSQTEATGTAVPLPFDATPFAMSTMADAGQLLARLASAAERLGVQTVFARQGVNLAGRIRPTDRSRSLRVPAGTNNDRSREVPVRWVVELNNSHSATEHLATLAHELGHLFCGHVGADRGDDWPNRDAVTLASSEIEAEAVAHLVFGRLAPSLALPDYLRAPQLLKDAEDLGWTYVAQAADNVLELLALSDIKTHNNVAAAPGGLPSWASNVTVRTGGPDSDGIVLIRATPDEQGLPERVGFAWAAGTSGPHTPWIAVARTSEAFDAVLSYYERAEAKQPAARAVERLLPVRRLPLTVVTAGSFDQQTLIEVNADPPNHSGKTVLRCLSEVRRRGLTCLEPDLDESWLFTPVDYATGDKGFEQVLDWDDIYSEEEWRFLEEADRLLVAVRPDAGLAEPRVTELLAEAVSAARRPS